MGAPEVIQEIEPPLSIPFSALGGEAGAGSFTLKRLSRPILKVRIAMGGRVVTLFNCHLKSKLGEYDRPPGAEFAPAADLSDGAFPFSTHRLLAVAGCEGVRAVRITFMGELGWELHVPRASCAIR